MKLSLETITFDIGRLLEVLTPCHRWSFLDKDTRKGAADVLFQGAADADGKQAPRPVAQE